MAAPKKRAPKRAARSSSAENLVSRRHAEVPFVGRLKERERLSRAISQNSFPQSLLLIGSPGVGKQRLGEWIAQSLLCDSPRSGSPCGVCNSCRQVRELAHPDFHIFAPHGSLGGGTPDAQLEAVDTVRTEQMEARRSDALAFGANPEDSYYLATVRSLRKEAIRRPVAGPRKVFLLADADRLSARDGATSEAANALLKVLEEPPTGTHFILTSAAPHRIPTTIRSRTTELCLTPLEKSEVLCILQEAIPSGEDAPTFDEIELAAKHSEGSMQRARLWLSPSWQKIRERAIELVIASLQDSSSARYGAVRTQGAWAYKEEGAKSGDGTVSDLLKQIEDVLIEGGRFVCKDDSFEPSITPALSDALTELEEEKGSGKLPHAGQWADAAALITPALSEIRGSVNAKLVLHTLLVRMARILST